jgi:hypothetical protein
MKKKYSHAIVAILMVASFITAAHAQDVYTVTGTELLFQSGKIEKNGADVNTNMRFTLFFHLGEYVHFDMGNYVGLYTGVGVRNVGFITDEDAIKTKYRSYMLGAPLALKLGSFRDGFYVYGGGEYEWMFHFKQKTFVDDQKTKYSEWFSNRTPDFIPSVFAGIQFPYGFNVKFKYYLKDFLNHDYQGKDDYSDYTVFTRTQVWYISVSFQIRNSKMMEYNDDYTGGVWAKN